MALTLTALYKGKFSDRRLHLYSVTFDSSYAAGGEAVTANDLGLDRIDVILPPVTITGHTVVWDSTASKLRSFVDGSTAAVTGSTAAGPVMAESTAGTDLSTVTGTIIAIGI